MLQYNEVVAMSDPCLAGQWFSSTLSTCHVLLHRLACVHAVQYNEVVARSMSDPIVGGSSDCLDIITKGHEQIGHMLATKAGRVLMDSIHGRFFLFSPSCLRPTLTALSHAAVPP